MKKPILILSHNNFLEQALCPLPELADLEFITSTTLIEGNFLHILYEAEFAKLATAKSSYSLDLPININEVVSNLVNLNTNQIHHLGEIQFNFRAKELTYKDSKISLTEVEAKILLKLITTGEAGISKEDLAMLILGYAKDAETKTVENHLYNLKNKLSSLDGSDLLILNKNIVTLVN